MVVSTAHHGGWRPCSPRAEVRDDHAAVGRVAVECAQLLEDVLVGETVEAVAPDASVPQVLRQGIHLGDPRHLAVKGGIEAGHLRNARVGLPQALDDLESLRQVLRVQSTSDRSSARSLVGDQRWGGVPAATLHDALPDGAQLVSRRWARSQVDSAARAAGGPEGVYMFMHSPP